MNGTPGWSSPLSSAQWHRMAHIRPRLAEHVRITRQWLRGQRWHVLQDARSGQSCRLNAAAYDIAARLDGRCTLQSLWRCWTHAGNRVRTAAASRQSLPARTT